jgi:hypothetical protein
MLADPFSTIVIVMTTSGRNSVVRRFVDEAINNGRLKLIDELRGPDLVWR